MSEENFHHIDPNGDVVLILRNPGASFAVWDPILSSDDKRAVEIPSALDVSNLSSKTSKVQAPAQETGPDWNQIGQIESDPAPPPADDDDYWPPPNRKGKKKKKAPSWTFFTPAADASIEGDVGAPSAEATVAGLSGSHGNHIPLSSEAVDAVERVDDHENPQPEVCQELEPESHEEPIVKYLVSSRHLALASQYFSAKFSGPWIETSVKHIDGCYHMDATDWDSEALLILMQVIHGKTRSVPRHINLEMLAKLAVLVDYYDCHEVIEVYCPLWIGSLKDKLPDDYGRDMVLWLLISHIFQQDDIFRQMTQVAVLKSDGPIRTMELPIPSSVVDVVDWRRQDAVEFMLKVLQKLLRAFRNDTAGCSFECSSILLGALTKEMDKHRLLDPQPASPYSGYSIADTEKTIRTFRSPQWSSEVNLYSGRHRCTLVSMIDCYLNGEFDKSKKGFELSGTIWKWKSRRKRREKDKAILFAQLQ
ncbi:hypothetical protein CFIO01_07606 [Colletotrichum fioriniae PJ7]|uniref:BTB domain-containing protein n=1 Tax=Colletotrichum fioriniae PJ7 TaxID=1445577 RepID=A0A010SMA6_9PEZI|nr:hypothetical protein CFIO01_07606 [Colletotrichum fioriniae PJ7]